MSLISVQISTHNRRDILRKVLEYYDDQSLAHDRYEVIVICDGCTDGTQEMVKELSGKVRYLLKLIDLPKTSLSKARNQGILNTDAEIILITDDDVMPDRDLLKEHLLTHQRANNLVVNGWVNHVTELKRPPYPKWRPEDFSTSFFWTSNVSVRREHLIQAGLFSEEFTEYGWEDIEMGYRLRELGLKRVFNRKAIGYHYKPPWRREWMKGILNQKRQQARMAWVYLSKRRSFRAKLAVGLHPLNRLWLKLAKLLNFKERASRTLSQLEEGPLDGKYLKAMRTLARIEYYEHLFQILREGDREGF